MSPLYPLLFSALLLGFNYYCLVNRRSSWFLNLMVMHVVLTAVVAPWLGYEIFDRQGLSVVWNKQMMIPFGEYFSFVIPAVACYQFGLFFGGRELFSSRWQLLWPLERTWPLVVGIVSWTIKLMSATLWHSLGLLPRIFYLGLPIFLFWHCSKAENRLEKMLSIGATILWVADYLRGGMFGELIIITALIFLSSVKKMSWGRMSILTLSFMALLSAIQISKEEYRVNLSLGESVYDSMASSAKVSLPNSQTEFFKLYWRMNQGQLISEVMAYTPSERSHSSSMLFEEIVAVLVPRFLWKDKPGVGGALKIKNYTSVKSNTDQTSFNISFLGDFWIALGSYGIILSFFWGQVQARVFLFLLELVRQNWMSFGQMLLCLLYFDAAETDLYAALNWVLKVGILILIVNQLSAPMRRGRSWDKKSLAS